jgi:hypothetical protein
VHETPGCRSVISLSPTHLGFRSHHTVGNRPDHLASYLDKRAASQQTNAPRWLAGTPPQTAG